MAAQRFGGNRLAFVAGILAAALGVLMLVAGAGLALAVLSSPQPKMQVVTALVLAAVGSINLWVGRRVWRAEPRALLESGAATAALILYLGIVLQDFGEPLWAHVAYLLLLLSLCYRGAMHRRDLA